ncbi:MAG: hypothetical protein JWO74_1046 [Solirubrobacterales bacterium]|nr:hypothetical protein [Solirubrobacterales bacterium]
MHRTLRRAGVLAALAVPALGAGVAAADTTVAADPTAQNVTTYGSTSAWSRKAGDGTYHLVVSQAGQVADAPVPASGEPYDPDLGPTKANGTALSSDAPEVAPSFFKDAIAFSRTSGPKPGLYLSRPSHGLKRLSRKPAAETDLAATRVVGRFGERTHSLIRVLNYGGDDVRIVARAKTEQRVASPTLSRFNAYWLRIGSTLTGVETVGVNAHRGLRVKHADRQLTGQVTSLSITNIPTLYTNADGVQHIDPKLEFAEAGLSLGA